MKRLVTKSEYDDYFKFLEEGVESHAGMEVANQLLADLHTMDALIDVFPDRAITADDVGKIRDMYLDAQRILCANNYQDGTLSLASLLYENGRELYSIIDAAISIIDLCEVEFA